ncbi:MAG TPA: amino acid permease [Terriglobales bacterium]|nr:amino acid permease [Terriglobales bacterium]
MATPIQPAPSATPSGQPSLQRTIRRWELVLVTINSVIGGGIFGLPSKAFALAAEWSLVSFVVCALAASLIVLCFAEVASRYSATGGPYLYAREAFGPAAGFVVGWLVWLARLTSFSANANLLVAYLGFFFPAAAVGVGRAGLLIGVTGALIAINVLGIRDSTNANNFFSVGKIVPLAIFVIWGMFHLSPGAFTLGPLPDGHAFTMSVLLLLYAFTGFEMAVIPGGEMRDPQRDLPRALLAGMAVVVAIYIAIQVVCIGTLPELAASQRPLTDAAVRFLGAGGAVLITVGIVLSLGGNLNTVLLAGSRVVFAIAERGELPRALATIHPRRRTPHWAVLLTGSLMMVLSVSGGFVGLATISTLARLSAYIVTCAALIRLRRMPGATPAMFTLRFGALIACAAVLLGLWMLSSAGWQETGNTALATLVGLAIFAVMRAKVKS